MKKIAAFMALALSVTAFSNRLDELNEVKHQALAIDHHLKELKRPQPFHWCLARVLRSIESSNHPVISYWRQAFENAEEESTLNKAFFSGDVFPVLDEHFPPEFSDEVPVEWIGDVIIRPSNKSWDVVNVIIELDEASAARVREASEEALAKLGYAAGCLTGDPRRKDTRHVSLGLRIPVSWMELQKLQYWAVMQGKIHGKTLGSLKLVTPPDIRAKQSAISLVDESSSKHFLKMSKQLNLLWPGGNQLPTFHITQGNLFIHNDGDAWPDVSELVGIHDKHDVITCRGDEVELEFFVGDAYRGIGSIESSVENDNFLYKYVGLDGKLNGESFSNRHFKYGHKREFNQFWHSENSGLEVMPDSTGASLVTARMHQPIHNEFRSHISLFEHIQLIIEPIHFLQDAFIFKTILKHRNKGGHPGNTSFHDLTCSYRYW